MNLFKQVNAARYRYRSFEQTRAAKKLIKSNKISPLEAEQVKEVEEFWGSLGASKGADWHRWYASVNSFDKYYVPSDVYASVMLPRLQNQSLAKAWADKSYFTLRFGKGIFPYMYGCCVEGLFLDGEYHQCSVDELVDGLLGRDKILIKPSLDSSVGKGVEILRPSELGRNAMREKLESYGDNYVIQEVVEQHETMSKLNSSSINIIRINSLRLNGRICVLDNAIVRFGIEGSITDVSWKNGKEQLNVVGIDASGRFMGTVFDADGNKSDGFGLEGIEFPGYESAKAVAKTVHEGLHHFDLVGFDFAIDREGKPVMLEYNLVFPGITFPQYAHGPFFGIYTQEVVKTIEEKNPKGLGR